MLLWSIAPFIWIFRAFVLSHPCPYREVSQLCSGSFIHSAKRLHSLLCAVFSRRSPFSVMNKPQHTSRHQAKAFLPWPSACYLCKAHYGLENCFLSAFIFNVSPALSRQCCTCRHPLSGSGCSPPLHARWPAPRRNRCRLHSPDNCAHDTGSVAKPDQCTAIYLHLDIAACQRLRDTRFIGVAQPDIAKMPSLHGALFRSRSDLGLLPCRCQGAAAELTACAS